MRFCVYTHTHNLGSYQKKTAWLNRVYSRTVNRVQC